MYPGSIPGGASSKSVKFLFLLCFFSFAIFVPTFVPTIHFPTFATRLRQIQEENPDKLAAKVKTERKLIHISDIYIRGANGEITD